MVLVLRPPQGVVLSVPSNVVARSSFPISVTPDGMPVPFFYSAPVTTARWNGVTEFGRDVGLHNPEWRSLQSVPCPTLLEGAIAANLNVRFFFWCYFLGVLLFLQSLLPLKVAYAQVNYLVYVGECNKLSY